MRTRRMPRLWVLYVTEPCVSCYWPRAVKHTEHSAEAEGWAKRDSFACGCKYGVYLYACDQAVTT